MSQPVKVSDELLLDARLAGEAAERSIAGQIEYWARLGRAVELHLRAAEAIRLKRAGEVCSLSELMATVGTPSGRKRLASALRARPFPHFEPAPGKRRLLVRIEENGVRTLGRFVDGTFRPRK